MIIRSGRVRIRIRSFSANARAQGQALMSRYCSKSQERGRRRGYFDGSHLNQDAEDRLSISRVCK